ncbi:hypothetical protein MBLNU459_g2369t1 [Dothideomycetes sp. NU459]
MSQTDDKLDGTVTVTAVDVVEDPVIRPLCGRRRTTNSFGSPNERTGTHTGEEDALTKIGNFLYQLHSFSIITRYALYVLPVAGLLAIPLALCDTIYKHARAGNIRLLGLFIWIEVVWLSLWVCKLCAKALPIVFQATCGLVSTGIRKYSLVLLALEIPLSLFIWSIVSWATLPVVCAFDKKHCGDGWITTFHTALVATIAVTAIFLAEKFFVQLVSINYHRKQFDSKIRESKRTIHILDHMYEASRTLFPPFCQEFLEDDYLIQDPDTSGMRKTLDKAGLHTRFFNDIGRARDKFTAAFGNMASEISGKQVFNPTAAHSIVIAALETKRASKALARRVWLSFVSEGKDALYKQDIIDILGPERVEEAEEIFAALDKDCNGDVSLDEMTMLVVEVGIERKNRAKSMHDINQAIGVLDRLLSLGVMIAVAFVYAAFFSKTLASKTTTLWSTFTGLAFAIGGTVTEFLSCCNFLFIKHAYDVGDRVDIDKNELIVEHISLMYSVFRRVDSNKTVQIPHTVANGLWIENVSRSKAMKERLTIAVSASTSSADILALRGELEKFVQASENKRDFQPELDIELISVGDMKQLDLRVEIRHKSNFSNELLRSTRRNKFMCELLASMRRIPIEPPGGKGPPLGGPSNPTYSVAVTDDVATAACAAADAEKEGKRLFPSGKGLPAFMPEPVATALAYPATGMIASVTGRRGSQVSHSGLAAQERNNFVGRRKSCDSLRITVDDPRRMHSVSDVERATSATYGTVTYLGPPHQ